MEPALCFTLCSGASVVILSSASVVCNQVYGNTIANICRIVWNVRDSESVWKAASG